LSASGDGIDRLVQRFYLGWPESAAQKLADGIE
jgi:hypothetical protein